MGHCSDHNDERGPMMRPVRPGEVQSRRMGEKGRTVKTILWARLGRLQSGRSGLVAKTSNEEQRRHVGCDQKRGASVVLREDS